MAEKVISLKEAVALIPAGAKVAVGGNLLYRVPSALVREMAKRGLRGLKLIKTAASYDVDLLSAAGCLSEVWVGFVGYENEFGFAQGFRRAVEEGKVRVKENA